MKGLAYNTLAQLVARDHGEDAWDDILDRAGLDGAYTSLGSYPDEDLLRLVAAASEHLDTPADDIVRWFGREAFPIFAEIQGGLRERHTTTRSFVLTLNDVIHPQVRKLYPGADVPEFAFDTSSDVLVMDYRSRRRLCTFAEGLLEGSATYFGERVAIKQPRCMNRGDEKCLLELRFTR